MSNIPTDLKYAVTHEWARIDDEGVVTVGISDHAQVSLGDVVFIELPEIGAELNAGDEAAVVESVKAASDVYAPVSGEVVAINANLEERPELVNSDPYGEGWFYRIQATDPAELNSLLDARAYEEACSEEDTRADQR